MIKSKTLHLFLLITACFLTASSFYLEFVLGLEPCVLCILQRVLLIFLIFIYMQGVFLKQKGWLLINALAQCVVASLGVFASSRQIWLQTASSVKHVTCTPGFSFLLKYGSWSDTLHALFYGTTDCSKSMGAFLGISLAQWTFLFFLGFFVCAIASFLKARHKP